MRPDLTDDEIYEAERRRAMRPLERPIDRPLGAADSLMPPPLQDDYAYRHSPLAEDMDYRADQELLCDRCGAELPPQARFCAACGTSIEPSGFSRTFNRVETRLNRWFSPDGVLARQYGLTPASMVAIAVALFCVLFAVVVQFTIPESSPYYTRAELYEIYATRSLLWLAGAITALVAALLFKRSRSTF